MIGFIIPALSIRTGHGGGGTQSCLTLSDLGLQPTRLLSPRDFPGKHNELGSHFLFQGIFSTQGSNSCLLHWQADSLPLYHLGLRSASLKRFFLSHIVQLPISQGKNSFYSGMIILYSLLLNGLSERALASSF